MSKNLYLIRHAMALENEQGQKDVDRVLISDGVQTATKTGHHFKQNNIQPDIIITSPAIRAHATAMLIAEQLKYNTEQIHINDELYEASVRTLLQVVNRLKDDWEEVFIVAHNPTVSYLSEYITQAVVGSIVPAGYVHIQLPFRNWDQVTEGNGELIECRDPATFDF